MKLYLAHPTLSRKEIREWELKTEEKFNFELLNPFYDVKNEEVKRLDNGTLMPFEYTSEAKEIVKQDLDLLDKCNGLLGIVDENAAIGLFMEVFYAKQNYKPVILICPYQKYRYHPWLLYCADVIFYSYEEFEEYWENRKQEKQILIGICGRKRVGKDTVAKYLVEKYGFKQFAFADEIKATVKSVFGFSLEKIEQGKDKLRPLLQQVGTKIREIDENAWINMILSRIENYQYVLPDIYKKIVISDVRLIKEVEILRKNNYKIWKIWKKNEEIYEYEDDVHITETEIPFIPSDHVIINRQNDIENFYKNIDLIMEKI